MSSLRPCWTPGRVERVFRLQAADMSRADFLASHTPMRNLAGDGLFPRDVDEELILSEVRRNDREHSLMVVRGGPGGGKSHLVRWLQFRLEPIAEEENLEIIFVERKNSTLRGVIEQVAAHTKEHGEIAGRLREGMGRLNETGRMGRIKDEWAREIDRHQIRSENLGPDERRVLLNAHNVSWGDLFRTEVARFVLEEKEGFFSRIARQIGIDAADGSERLTDPGLRLEDLNRLLDAPTKQYRHRGGARAAEARDFLEAIVQEQVPDVPVRDLLQVLNSVMSGVVRTTLNISRSDFEGIFRKIRENIFSKDPHRRLVLLIEDLFPFKHLDEALMNALIEERKSDEPIARLTTVVGMTTGYWEDQIVSGRSHMAQRVTHHVVVPVGDAVDLTVSGGAARFIGRYLNVVRHEKPEALKKWADTNPASPPPSACSSCPHPDIKQQCLATFGALGSGGEAVGLFPFTELAANNFAQSLRDGGFPSPSPRLLVVHALDPLLRDGLEAAAAARPFPRPETFNVRTLEFPEVESASLKESLAGAFSNIEARETANWLVRAWGDTTQFRSPGKLADVPVGVFSRFGVELPEHLRGDLEGGKTQDIVVTAKQEGPVEGEGAEAPTSGSREETKRDEREEPDSSSDASNAGNGRSQDSTRERPRQDTTRRKPKPKGEQTSFNPKTWLAQETIPDPRKLVLRALVDAVEFAPDRVTQTLREKLRPAIIYVDGQQGIQPKGVIHVKRSELAADGLAAVQDLSRMRDRGPLPSTLRHLRAFRREFGSAASGVLTTRECGENAPEAVATAAGWILLLDGILRGRVDCRGPERQWLFWSLATLDADQGSDTLLPGFEQIARSLGQRTDRFRRSRLRDLWHRVSLVPRGDDTRIPGAFYAGTATLSALDMLTRGDAPPMVQGTPIEPEDFLELTHALTAVREGFAAARAALVKTAVAARNRIAQGAGRAAETWKQAAIELCLAARRDQENDSLVQNASQVEKRCAAWSPPSATLISDWDSNLETLAAGKVSVQFWRATAIFKDPAFREFDQLHLRVEQLVDQVQARKAHLTGAAPVTDAFDRARAAATALRELLKPTVRRT